MKKILLLALLVSLGFSKEIGCKKKDSMYAISDATDRKAVFLKLYNVGECTAVDVISIVDYSGRLKKVLSSTGQYYWIINK